MIRAAFALCLSAFPALALADYAVVGTGTAASCTTEAYNSAMQLLVDGPQARGGVLTFRCGPQPHTIAMNREWGLTDEVLIDGAGLITLDGQNLHRFYQTYLLVEGRTLVTLKDIRLIRGFAGSEFGGAVFMRLGTSLTLTGVTVADCRATNAGGAVAAEGQTLLTIANSAFLNNRGGSGGALAIRAATQISDSTFSGNRAEAGNAEGGAIQSYEQPLSISRSVLQDNVSAWDGGAILKVHATLTLDDVSLLRNTAAHDGAGIYSETSVSLQADRVRVIDNVGDGLFVAGGLVLRRAMFRGNRNNGSARSALELSSSSAALLIEKSTFAGNDNAIFLQRSEGTAGSPGTLRLDNVTVHNSRFSTIGILDFSNSMTVVIDQSSIVEPSNIALQLFGGRLTYSSSILFGGVNPSCQTLGNPASQFVSGGNNLVAPGCPLIGSDGAVQSLADLQLSALANNGGDVETLLPAITSPAIDRRPCLNVDARDRPRPVDADQNGSSLCDIGAVERQLQETTDEVFRDGFE